MAALLVIVVLALLGCDDEGADFEGIEEDDLANRTFSSSNCQALGITGSCTLTVGVFTDDSAPVTITTNPTATGTILIDEASLSDAASCDIVIAEAGSDFPAGTGPQSGETILLEPCEIDDETDELRLRNETTDASSFFTPM
jgi:hypothetical protein